jgi:hypothetical protein
MVYAREVEDISQAGEGMRMTQSIITALVLADVVVIGDKDPDPHVREETRNLAERRTKELDGKLFFPPEECKDVDEWILKEHKGIKVLKEIFDHST